MTTIPTDSVKLRDMRWDVQGPEVIAPDVLVTIPYTHPRRTEIVIDTDEFSAVCPWSGLPDFASLTLRYLPGDRYLELKSFKYYLTSFRNVGIFQEDANNRLVDDLVRCLAPLWLEVALDYKIRGGLHTVTRNLYHQPELGVTYDLSGEQPVRATTGVDWQAWRDEQRLS